MERSRPEEEEAGPVLIAPTQYPQARSAEDHQDAVAAARRSAEWGQAEALAGDQRKAAPMVGSESLPKISTSMNAW